MTNYKNKIYYIFKPCIPRRLQIILRRQIVQIQRGKYADIWPIDERASKQPEDWQGWPENKQFALVLTHDVETSRGLDKCLDLMELDQQLGFRSSFNFVAEEYNILSTLRSYLIEYGFEVGLHGLTHGGQLYKSRKIFDQQKIRINKYLKEWNAVGFRSPSMHRNFEWIHDLNIEYDSSSFDSDPFEPQPDGMGTIFPFFVHGYDGQKGYVELPYTLPQDFTLFVLMKEKNIDIWKKKLDWIASHRGMALIITHPDYMNFNGSCSEFGEYPAEYYQRFLEYIKSQYEGQYWHVLPKEIASFAVKNRLHIKSTCRSNAKIKRACMLAYTFYESDNRVRRYAETLARQGYQVDAVVLKKGDQPRNGNLNGVKICRIQKRVRDEKSKFSYLYRLLKFFINSALFISKQHLQQRYDLIHVHSVPDFEVFATFLAKMTGARIILDIHDIVPEFYASRFKVGKESSAFKALALIEKASIAFSDHVIIANHIWEKTLVSRSVTKDKCTTMLNYPDPSIFYRRPRTRKDDKFIIIYPGTFSWHQGVDIAVQAFAHIKDEVPEAEFYIYGDGPMRAEVQQLIADLGVQDRIFLNEPLPAERIAAVMADADLGVVPKRNDSFGGDAFSTKILEFMALGVPVVAAATRIDRYYFNDDIVRFFEPENAIDLALTIKELVRSRGLRERLALNATAFVADYTWDKKERDYLFLVGNIVEQRAG
jgi:glycosyltransferase involved in cell wall biosynthesis/peptidoglycan/xylan/chitin deacetylase (PgdA/CDA1 family)